MRKLNRPRRFLHTLLAALLSAACLASAVPAFALDDGETDYIIKYKASAAHLMEDDGLPFEVVSRSEALRLEREGVL